MRLKNECHDKERVGFCAASKKAVRETGVFGAFPPFLVPMMRPIVLMGYLAVEIHTTLPVPNACASTRRKHTNANTVSSV